MKNKLIIASLCIITATTSMATDRFVYTGMQDIHQWHNSEVKQFHEIGVSSSENTNSHFKSRGLFTIGVDVGRKSKDDYEEMVDYSGDITTKEVGPFDESIHYSPYMKLGTGFEVDFIETEKFTLYATAIGGLKLGGYYADYEHRDSNNEKIAETEISKIDVCFGRIGVGMDVNGVNIEFGVENTLAYHSYDIEYENGQSGQSEHSHSWETDKGLVYMQVGLRL